MTEYKESLGEAILNYYANNENRGIIPYHYATLDILKNSEEIFPSLKDSENPERELSETLEKLVGKDILRKQKITPEFLLFVKRVWKRFRDINDFPLDYELAMGGWVYYYPIGAEDLKERIREI